MNYKKQIGLLFSFLIVIEILIGWNGYLNEFVKNNCLEYHKTIVRCVEIMFFEKYQALALVVTSILISISPVYFLSEQVYMVWRKFALFAIPIIALLIFMSPARALGDYISIGYDREVAAMLFSGLFLVVSWLIALFGYLKKGK